MFDDTLYREGHRLTIYVELDDPTRVATPDGLASERWAMQLPLAIGALGGALLIVVAVARIIYLIRLYRAVE